MMDDLAKRAEAIGWEALARLLDAELKRLAQITTKRTRTNRAKKRTERPDLLGYVPLNVGAGIFVKTWVEENRELLRKLVGLRSDKTYANMVYKVLKRRPPVKESRKKSQEELKAELRSLGDMLEGSR